MYEYIVVESHCFYVRDVWIAMVIAVLDLPRKGVRNTV